MALPKCGKCNSGLFELREYSPIGAEFKINLVLCQACGVPAGSMDFYAVGNNLAGISKRIAGLEEQVQALMAYAQNVDRNLVKLANVIERK